MPMDSAFNNVQGSPPSENFMFKHRRIGKQEKISFKPRRCYLSGKKLWLKRCVVVTSMVTGPGFPEFEDFWCDKKEFLFSEIRGW